MRNTCSTTDRHDPRTAHKSHRSTHTHTRVVGRGGRTEATHTEAMELGWLSTIRGIERRGTPCDLSGVKGQVTPG